VTTRRQFLASAGLLLAGTGCLGRGSSSVETFGSGFLSRDQPLERSVSILAAGGEVPTFAISEFQERTGVKVHIETTGTDQSLLLRLAAGGYGSVDVILIGAESLGYLVDSKQVEPIARSLVPGLSLLQPPFDDLPQDGGLRHDVPSSYGMTGVAARDNAPLDADTWAGFFTLAERKPGRVAVPDRANDVIGATLVSLGHSWDTDSSGDLNDAETRLQEVLPGLRVIGRHTPSETPSAKGAPLAQLVHSRAYRTPTAGVRFFLPAEGGALDVRSYAIPAYAPHPVAAHAWLQNWLQPVVEAGSMSELQIPVPLAQARALIDPALAANEAICPPLPALQASIEPDISADGEAARQQIWADLTA
jgi:spermidine/putrescine transport system substrate-binding protein